MLFAGASVVKVRDGQVASRPVYAVVGVTVNGERDIPGLRAGDGGEGARFWPGVLTGITNRGAGDVCTVVCGGLKGLPEPVTTAWPLAQACVLRLIRSTFRHASRRGWDEPARDLRPVCTAVNAEMAAARSGELAARRGGRYPAIVRLWRSARQEFIPFPGCGTEIRRVICGTNAIESLNARCRRAIRARGHFPDGQAALKCPYLVTRSLDPAGRGRARWAMRWKPALNAFAITFEGRIAPSATN